MKRNITILILLVAGMIPIATSSHAQQVGNRGQDLVDNLRAELERNAELIHQAAEIVQTANSREGRLILEKAVEIHKSSMDDFGHKRYQMAAEKAKLVRELAQKAIAAARTKEENRDAVLRKLEHTKELLERVRESAPQNAPPAMQSLFETARTNLQRAWEFYRNGEYRPAVKLCNQVESALRKLMEALQRQDRQSNVLDRRMEQIRAQIERVQTILGECSSEIAADLLQKAKQSLQQARQFYANDNVEAARASVQNAARLANRAAEECRDKGQFQKMYQRLTNLADRLSEMITPGDDHGRKLLQQSREQLQIAKAANEKGNVDAATAALRAAEMSLKQLQKHLNFQQGQ